MIRIRGYISTFARKYLLPVSLTAAAFFLVAGGRYAKSEAVSTRQPGFSWSELRDIYRQEDELNERVRGLTVYQEQLDRIKRDLLLGELPLKAAVDDITGVVSELRPRLLNVPTHRPGVLPARARMALLLLHSLAQDHRKGLLAPQDREVVSRLCAELKSWEGLDAGTMEDLTAQLR